MSVAFATIRLINERKTEMDLKDFRDFITAQRLAEIKEKRNNNLTAILSVANATISTTERKEN
jgi:hypothetical protein